MSNLATPDLYGYDEWVRRYVEYFRPEQRLAGLTPEQRLAGLTPEQLAGALTPEQHLLALPDEALRALSDDYVATLDPATQAAVRARRGR